MSRRLWAQGVAGRRVQLTDGQDSNSFFVGDGDTHQFQRLLEAARPDFRVVRQPQPTPAQSPYRVAQQKTGWEVI
jgi:hypothetical protein